MLGQEGRGGLLGLFKFSRLAGELSTCCLQVVDVGLASLLPGLLGFVQEG